MHADRTKIRKEAVAYIDAHQELTSLADAADFRKKLCAFAGELHDDFQLQLDDIENETKQEAFEETHGDEMEAWENTANELEDMSIEDMELSDAQESVLAVIGAAADAATTPLLSAEQEETLAALLVEYREYILDAWNEAANTK